MTVSFLNSLYQISSNVGNSHLQQAVFETSNEYYSPSDLLQFQNTFGLPRQAAFDHNGFNTTDCVSKDCYEGNLDLQYIMGVAQVRKMENG